MGRSSSSRRLIRPLVTAGIIVILLLVVLLIFKGFVDEYQGNAVSEETAVITVYDIHDLDDITDMLEQQGIIKYKWLFNLYANTKNLARGFKTGDITLQIGSSYATIIDTILKPQVVYKPRETVTIRFKEGCEVQDVVRLFIENGIGDEATFAEVLSNYDFGYSYIPEAGTENRMEGFLFPDTYEFFSDSSVEDALQKMVDNFNTKVWNSAVMKEMIQSSGKTLYDVLKMASIVEKEAGNSSDMPLIASVFYNRLNVGVLNEDGVSRKKLLQSDATYQYVLPQSERKVNLTSAQIADKSNKYNTYQFSGLTPTPICNPSLAAIKAAAQPAESDYFYFYATKSGNTLFAKTYEQHKNNINNDK